MEKVLVVFWSGTGNTKIMAEKVAEGLRNAGANVDLKEVSEVSASDVAGYNKIAFGCPSMGVEVLEESEFEPFFAECESSLSGKKVGLFGSYGWGDGEWMRNWVERCEGQGINVLDGGLIINETPDEDGEDLCEKYGEKLASF